MSGKIGFLGAARFATLVVSALAGTSFVASIADAQSFNRTFNFGTHVYKTAPSKTERVTSRGNSIPILTECFAISRFHL